MEYTQISDEAVKAKTGRSWKEWFSNLDTSGCKGRSHKEIIAVLRANSKLTHWWQQSITVAYEQARGMRQPHEQPDGFQISKSKTISASVDAAYNAWTDAASRGKWLTDPKITIRKATKNRSLRITWVDGVSSVDVHFYAKAHKVQVSLNHGKLPNLQKASEMKRYWGEQLKHLAEFLK